MIASELDDEIPKNYQDAMRGGENSVWLAPIRDELEALLENETWEETQWTPDLRPLTTKWVFALKRDASGKIEKHKARLVVRGFEQREGVDFYQTFAPVARVESIRLLIALAAAKDWHMTQFDISTAFLNGKIEEDVYIKPPDGLTIACGRCLKLKRALYGLKQAPRAWNSTFDCTIKRIGFSQTYSDSCVYVNAAEQVYLVLYVDDAIVFGKDAESCQRTIDRINQYFKLRVLDGTLFLGMEIRRDDGIKLSQQRYIRDILSRFRLAEAKEVSCPLVKAAELMPTPDDTPTIAPYRQAIGCLQYLACCARPDIAFPVNFLAQFSVNPAEKHWAAVKRIIRYLKYTIDVCLHYRRTESMIKISAFSDADWGGDSLSGTSTSGGMIMINDSPTSYLSRKQKSIAQSSTESEYIAASEIVKKLKWVVQLMGELKIEHSKPVLLIDNQSTKNLIESLDTNRRSKHISIRYHLIRDEYKQSLFDLKYIESEQQRADLLTKPLGGKRIEKLLTYCNMKPQGGSRDPKISKLALLITSVLCMSQATNSVRLEKSPPLIFMDSDYIATEGVKQVDLSLAIINPCSIDSDKQRSSTYEVESMMYSVSQNCYTENVNIAEIHAHK